MVPTLRPWYVGAEALGGVAQHPQALARADRLDCVVVGRLAEQVDGDDARRPEVQPLRGRDRKLEARRVEVEAVLDDVGEDRRRAEPSHDLGRRREGEARAEHRVAGAMPFAISTRASASVPLAQETTWLAPQNAASSASSAATSGPRM